ncbi:MAG: hypothetical protein LC799_20410 [Actinobacteria bacterium]|nr:hypothetical protein [Actinomycetota bacterium]
MSANVKKYLSWIALAFVAFYLFTQPEQSANLVRSGIGLLQQAANSVVTFFESLV